MTELVLVAPLPGWVGPLDDVPDEVFAGRMMGDGLAIDPTGTILAAPCDGELLVVPETAHAVTIRAKNGAEILLHVGVDTVALNGAGFTALVRAGQRVRAGEPLVRIDLERIARSAKSLLTPILVTEPDRFQIVERRAPGRIGSGERLMTLRLANGATRRPVPGVSNATATGTLDVPLPHGLHARPAALLVRSLKNLRAEVTLSLRDRTANARSAVALLALGARRGDRLALRATGIDAALARTALEQAFASALASAPAAPASGPIAGVAASQGLAIGRAAHIVRAEPSIEEDGAGAHVELQRFEEARERLRQRLDRLARGDAGERAGIMGAHLEFLDDPELLGAAHARIAEGRSAAFAWRAALRGAAGALDAIDDAHLAARAEDLRDLELQMLELLAGAALPERVPLPERAIVIARELLPSQFLALDSARIAGICTVSRAATSHVAILAGARDIPMLAGVDPSLLGVASGTPLLVDADRGRVTVDPDAAQLADAEARISERARIQARLRTAAALDCRTADGERVQVHANVGSLAEAAAAVASGAEGCGLLRTEFLFLDRAEPPDVAEQTREYQQVVDAFGPRPVVVRTLDPGNDKSLPFLPMPAEDNPALGLRGIRAGLWRPDLLRAQLAAILAVRPRGRCRILLPMVNEPSEIRSVREMLGEIAGVSGGDVRIPLGIMIETPVAAVNAARLAREADFFSIGTNDLTQYLLAVDRTHSLLAAGLDALHPAVLRVIGDVCAAARAAGREVAVCGGLASEPAAAPVLVGLGVGELSAIPAAIPAVKDAVRRHTLARCRELAGRAIEQDTPQDVRSLLAGAAAEPAP